MGGVYDTAVHMHEPTVEECFMYDFGGDRGQLCEVGAWKKCTEVVACTVAGIHLDNIMEPVGLPVAVDRVQAGFAQRD
eukprot:352205-Chlamydomonas_euryale.AAC.5